MVGSFCRAAPDIPSIALHDFGEANVRFVPQADIPRRSKATAIRSPYLRELAGFGGQRDQYRLPCAC